jgi:hypothetical protein
MQRFLSRLGMPRGLFPFFFSFLEIFNSSKIAVSNFYPEFVMGCQLDLYKIEFHYYIIVGRLECVYIV